MPAPVPALGKQVEVLSARRKYAMHASLCQRSEAPPQGIGDWARARRSDARRRRRDGLLVVVLGLVHGGALRAVHHGLRGLGLALGAGHLRSEEPELDRVAEHDAARAEVEEGLEPGRAREHASDHSAGTAVAREEQGRRCAGEQHAEGRGELLRRPVAGARLERLSEERREEAHWRRQAAEEEAQGEVAGERQHHPACPRLLAEEHGHDGEGEGLEADHARGHRVDPLREAAQRPGEEREALLGLLLLVRSRQVLGHRLLPRQLRAAQQLLRGRGRLER
eukprot:CAMPEP_0195158310 /NCGR_PEP_ID=MMETSP0448-20130528/185601_1 /TAXON_ID=66468 /ORGANISM="Heterocapsa triquestra, Strain CCMP 448" /LENGTH=279 /DNA_ID=CAMNT_0040197107 /DNA_START=716 /DNA_END=1552 /DNA_ORIENTATION=-